jgi:hypothetical protein
MQCPGIHVRLLDLMDELESGLDEEELNPYREPVEEDSDHKLVKLLSLTTGELFVMLTTGELSVMVI